MRPHVVEQLCLAAIKVNTKVSYEQDEMRLARIVISSIASLPGFLGGAITVGVIGLSVAGWYFVQRTTGPLLVISLFGLPVSMLVLLFWSEHRHTFGAQIKALDAVFDRHRVTREEWTEAKRRIRERDSKVLGFGVERRLDTKALG